MSELFRKRPWFLGLLIFVGATVPLWGAVRVETSSVTYKSGAEQVQGYLATPAAGGPFPALVVIHEWWGLNTQIKGMAEKLAREGYVALAVDLYRGRVTADPMEAHEFMRGVPESRGSLLAGPPRCARGQDRVDRLVHGRWLFLDLSHSPIGSRRLRHLLRPSGH
jgi:hypothetical protein